METYEECPKRFQVESLNKTPRIQGSAAGLGTVCHACMETWVKDEHYLAGHVNEWAVMQGIYDEHYWSCFSDQSRYDEGVGLVKKWLKRQDWTDREVLTVEVKQQYIFKTSKGDIPFNAIMDRKDRLTKSGDIEVIDYKTIALPLQPAELRQKIQARSYAMLAQIDHPEAKRIWVTFDLLRYDQVGIVFTIEENRATFSYIKNLIERILTDDDPQETLGNGCRWCVRRGICKTLNKHIEAGGPLGITEAPAAAKKLFELKAAESAIKAQIAELSKVLQDNMKDLEVTELELDGFTVKAKISSRRSIDAGRVLAVVGAEIMAGYANMGVGDTETMLSSNPNLTPEQRQQVKALFQTTYGEPTMDVKRKTDFDSVDA